MVWNEFLIYISNEYWGNYIFAALFGIALIGIFFIEKEKIKRYGFLWYPLLILIFIYNPLTVYLSGKIYEASTFDQYFRRFFNLIPVIGIIAYGLVLSLTKLHGKKKFIAFIGMLLTISIIGHSIYSEEWFAKAENRMKVPQDVVTISDLFADYDSDKIRIMAPKDLAVYLRQIDSRFSMPYARDIPDEAYELTNPIPKPQIIVDYCKEENIDFVVVSAVDTVLNTYLNYGFKLYGRTTYYAVLEPNDPDWILTEYEDESGDQGMAYIMKNINDGTVIVIDGGNAGNEEQMRKAIKKNGGVVDAWILSHYHKDHIDTFNAIYENPKGIKIKNIYATPLDAETFHSLPLEEWDDVDTFETFQQITTGADNINYIDRNDVLTFSDGLKITFFNSCDDVVIEGREDVPNNVSLVFKMETEDRSILICADAHSKYLAEYLVDTYGEDLHADILQCGHHGNNSMPAETHFYEVVAPEIAIFDAPEWVMTGAEYTAGALAAYLQDLGARIVWFETAPNIFGF
ncbi:Beta-lactamase superfamily domain-containing protein [Pseudobutyrivibrio sp. ACV-2]|uniref:ComEC/Rec2 family competence protein n=1 Tax=Pseudobutyrivibrio sp. ACV-2 TaxID=1520801 RepID=UPI00089966F5|nr:MBL fold metallo-hydrolase [Pseudobutyrivibrio sp. ACV-2]SEA51926.1 Beta-lactamase superfamily domain-containing protein [Pseudobutyrivibrio sp. ACV-2]